MSNSTLYVLGAGASIAGDFKPSKNYLLKQKMPSGSYFFYDIFKQHNEDGTIKHFLNTLGLTFEGLNTFITQAYRINDKVFNPNEWKKINLEDVMTFLSIGESMFSNKSDYQIAFKRMKENLMYYIVINIAMISFDRHDRKLDKLFDNLSSSDSILTFNWDLIAEDSLMRNNKSQYKNYIHFIENYETIKPNYSKGIFLKLHGSIDWGVCKNKKCELNGKIQYFKEVIKKEKFVDTFTICKKCGKSLNTQIIPPTSNKIIIQQDLLFHKEWLIAKNQLTKFKKIVFYGYSFPVTDFYSEWLFRQVNLIMDDGKPAMIEIIVINPAMKKRNSQTFKRYKTIFKGHIIKGFDSVDDYLSSIRVN